ncbi:MAG: 6-bladed beta-propeller, partial [Bacteroidota bacterium]
MQRRTFLRHTVLAAPALALPTAFSSPDLIVGQGDFRYRVRPHWAQVAHQQYPLLNCHEMVTDRSGKLYMLGDHPANNVLVFDRSGKVIDSWGYRYPAGHGLTIFDEGDEETLFICDTGSHSDRRGRWRNQPGSVTKTRLNGEIIFQLGHPQTIGVYQP